VLVLASTTVLGCQLALGIVVPYTNVCTHLLNSYCFLLWENTKYHRCILLIAMEEPTINPEAEQYIDEHGNGIVDDPDNAPDNDEWIEQRMAEIREEKGLDE